MGKLDDFIRDTIVEAQDRSNSGSKKTVAETDMIRKDLSQSEIVDIAKVVEKFAKQLINRKIDVRKAHYIGAGSKGAAFAIDDRVLKVTKDVKEANCSAVVKGHELGNIVRIYDVFSFPGTKLFGIWQEKLEQISAEDRNQFTEIIADVIVESGVMSALWKKPSWKAITETAIEGAKADDESTVESVQRVKNELDILQNKFQMDKITDQLRQMKIVYMDFHGGNIMKRGKEHVLIDLGYSNAPKRQIDKLEEGPPPIPASQRKIPRGKDGKPLGVDQHFAAFVVRQEKDKLVRRGIKISSLTPLGKGTRGCAFAVGGDKVFKVTNDVSEAVAAMKIKDQPLECVVKFYDVFRFPKTDPELGEIYGIFQERLKPLPSDQAKELDLATASFELAKTLYKAGGIWKDAKKILKKNSEERIRNKFPKFATDHTQAESAKKYAALLNEQYAVLTKKFGLNKISDELTAKGIKFIDFHSGNLMMRDNKYVLIDLGYSKVAGGKEPPVLEKANVPVLDESEKTTNPDFIKVLLSTYQEKLAKRAIDVNPAELNILGKGSYGSAITVTYKGKDVVLKITGDNSEAQSSVSIMGKKLNHIVEIYDVFSFPGQQHVYGILQERLSILSISEKAEFKELYRIVEESGADDLVYEHASFDKIISKIEDMFGPGAVVDKFVSLSKRFGFEGMIDDLRESKINFRDFHSGNIMKRGSSFVLIDLGFSRSPMAQVPMLERFIHMFIESIENAPNALREATADRVGVTIGRYQPFHRGHAAVVRELAKTHDRIIVLVAGNKKDKKNPFSFKLRKRMLELSLPELQNRLQIVKAEVDGSPSGFLPGILAEVAKSGLTSLKGDTAVEVLVGEDRYETVKQQFERAAAAKDKGWFDQSQVVVMKIPRVSDDNAASVSGTRVRADITSGNRAGFDSAMDPHLVSVPSELEKIWVDLRKELGISDVEEALVKDADGLSDAEVAAAVARAEGEIGKVLAANSKKLSAHQAHIDTTKLKKLGNGKDGVAFDINGRQVLKVTTDPREAQASMSIKGKSFKHIVRISDVFSFLPQEGITTEYYGIVEEKLQPLSGQEKAELDVIDKTGFHKDVLRLFPTADFDAIMAKVKDVCAKANGTSADVHTQTTRPTEPVRTTEPMRTAPAKKNTISVAAQGERRGSEVDRQIAQVEQIFRKFNVPEMLKELKTAGVKFYDFHSGNIMKRGNDYVVLDLGRSDARNNVAIPKLESIIEMIVSEISTTLANAPSFTQAGARAGSSGWSLPSLAAGAQRVPQDDDEDEGEESGNVEHRQLPDRRGSFRP